MIDRKIKQLNTQLNKAESDAEMSKIELANIQRTYNEKLNLLKG